MPDFFDFFHFWPYSSFCTCYMKAFWQVFAGWSSEKKVLMSVWSVFLNLFPLSIQVKWKWQNRNFWRIFFLVTNFYVLKLWPTLIKKFGGAYWLKIKIKKMNCFRCYCFFCVANSNMSILFHQCLGVKPFFETKFCQKSPYKIYFYVVWKVVAQSTTFVIYCG